MPQHDMNIADAAGAAFLADLNEAIAALVGNSSGASAPATTYAYQWWADTTSGRLKRRNAANSAWIDCGPLNPARVDVASAATIDLDAATSDYVRITGTTTIGAVTLADGHRRKALAGGAFTLTNGASLVVQGGADYTTTAGDLLEFIGESGDVVRVSVFPVGLLPALVSQAVAEAGTDASPRLWSAERVAQAAVAAAGLDAEVVTFTRDTTTASGTQVVTTTVQPTAIIFLATTTSAGEMSIGFAQGTNNATVFNNYNAAANTWEKTAARCISLLESGSASYSGAVSAVGATSFTITWTKVGSPTGTATVYALCLK